MSSEIAGKAFDFPLLKKVFVFVKPYRKIFLWAVVLTIVIAAAAPLRPWLIQFTLDHHVAAGDAKGLLHMISLLILLLLFQSAVQYFHAYSTNDLGQLVIRDMRSQLYGKIMGFNMKYFDRTPVGTPVTRLISDIEVIADIFSEGIIVIIGDLLQLIAIIGVMFFVDWRLAIISLTTIPFLVIATNIFKNKIKKVFTDVRNRVAELNVFVQEHITGMRIVQIFNREDEEMKKFSEINAKHRDANIRSVWYYSIFFPVVEILSAISIGLLVWWGAHGVLKEDVTFGNLVAFIMYIQMLFRPIRELADKFNTLQMGMVSSERIFRIFDRETGVEDEGKVSAENIKGHIVFENVWFAYNDDDYVLKDVSFEVKPNETIALAGATGSGKTTIINLLNRFYEINKGRILIDGVDIREYSLDSLRCRIGMVLQDVFLLSDSIKNNISLHDEEINSEKISKAARKVGAEKFIERLPGGFDFNVQERGALLSMGQRQLISFIRAYVYDPAIFILDEATSSVDSETEELITKATHAVTEGRTSIIIAHRLATVQNADKIIVLDHGKVMEQGNHYELLKKGGMYKQLYEIQFKKESTEV